LVYREKEHTLWEGDRESKVKDLGLKIVTKIAFRGYILGYYSVFYLLKMK